MIWGNDEQYSKEFQIESRKQTEAFSRKVEEDQKIYEESKEQSHVGSSTRQWTEERWTQGRIVNACTQKYLDAKITEARWRLAICMALTFFIKGQWAIWIILIILYNIYVKSLRQEMLEHDMNRGKKH
jgi:hypothetical protein